MLICRAFHYKVGMLLFLFGLLLSHRARGAVTFSVSPLGVSNLYAGAITLQINGLTNGETVMVEKYLDINTNRIIDGADWLVQSLRFTDGLTTVIAGVTNFNIPGDTSPTNGSITANVSFPSGGFAQQIAGTYAYKLSSPSGRFGPLTNLFTVTNLVYPQSFTGTVRSSGTNVPYAAVLLFTPPTPGGGMNPVAGTIANSLGSYSLKAPTGTYLLWAIRNNYVADLTSAPVLTLGPGITLTTNLNLLPATRTISGRLVDAANNTLGIPGISVFLQSTNNLVASGFSDANGNFTTPAIASQWQFGGDSDPLTLHGYLSPRNELVFDTTTGNVSAATIALPKGTALFYGSVKDDQNRPLAAVRLSGDQGNGSGPYRSDATTDPNGNYVMAVTSGIWSVNVSSDSSAAANYVFSEFQTSTNITDGTAVQVNFTGILATNQISGFVRDSNNSPITNVGVSASTVLNGINYNQYTRSDTSGHYSFKVPNGVWNVSVNCRGGSDSLNQLGYLCVNSQVVGITNNNGVANFTAPLATAHITGNVRDNSSNAVANVDVYAHDPSGTYFDVNGSTDSSGNFSLNVANGTWSVGVSCFGGNGGLSQLGYLCANEQPVTVSNTTATANFTVLSAPYEITGYVRDTGGRPITNVNVNANATIYGTDYNANSQTDINGFYSLNVASGAWNVNVNCGGGPDGKGNNDLASQGYLCVNGQSVIISNTNASANFTAMAAAYQISGYLRDTDSHPITNVNVNANATLNGTMYFVGAFTDTNGFYSLNVAAGDWNVNADCNALSMLGFLCVNNQSVSISSSNGVATFIATTAAYQIAGYVSDPGGHPITNVAIYGNGNINGTNYSANGMTDAGGHYAVHVINGIWNIGAACGGYNGLNQVGYLCLNSQTVNVSNSSAIVNFTTPQATRLITGVVRDLSSHAVSNVNVYASSGLYNANSTTDNNGSYSLNVANGAWDVNVDCNALSARGYTCTSDQVTNISSTNVVLNFTVVPSLNNFRPLLTVPGWAGPGQFQFTFNTVSGLTYTVQYSSNLWSWFSWITLGGTGGPLLITDPAATRAPRFYRVMVGP